MAEDINVIMLQWLALMLRLLWQLHEAFAARLNRPALQDGHPGWDIGRAKELVKTGKQMKQSGSAPDWTGNGRKKG